MTKTCGECWRYDHHHLLCVVGGDKEITDKACEEFLSNTPTNGDKIIAGGNRALAEFGANCMGYSCQCCAFKGAFGDCEKPIDKTCTDGVEAWLNAPAESEVEDV